MTAESLRLASRIKQARERLGLSQSEAAKAWGIPLPTLKKWEQSQRVPRGEALEKLRPLIEDKRAIKLPRIHRNLVAGNLSIDVSTEIPKTFQHLKLNNEESLTLGFADSGNLAQIILWFMKGLSKRPKGGAKSPPP